MSSALLKRRSTSVLLKRRSDELQRTLEASIPQRLPKPLRSECEVEFCVADSSRSAYGNERYDELYVAAPSVPPQCHKYQELLSQEAQPLETTTLGDANVEYTASDYYDSMRAVDKEHHHTTGTGFIKISQPADEDEEGFHSLSHPREVPHAPKSGISNPAMNDWVPQCDIKLPLSTKPSRSEPSVDSWN
jgi:hypothetical protein